MLGNRHSVVNWSVLLMFCCEAVGKAGVGGRGMYVDRCSKVGSLR